MRKLIVSTYATLDGRVDEIQDWALPYDDAAVARYHDDLLANSDGLLLGRKTYEVFAAIWPPRSGKLPYVDKLNSMPKYVASTTLRDLQWENSRLIEGDIAEGVATLKQQAGQDLVVYGGQDLTHSCWNTTSLTSTASWFPRSYSGRGGASSRTARGE